MRETEPRGLVDLQREREERERRHRIERRRHAERLRRALRYLADPDQVWRADGEVLELASDIGPDAVRFAVALLDVLDDGHAQLVVADRGRVAAWPTPRDEIVDVELEVRAA